MPLNYSHTTFAQAKAALAQLLNDTGNVFYANVELGVYIVEALRFWGAATGYWRDRGTFTTTTSSTTPGGTVTLNADNPWYDIPTFLPTLRGYNVTDSNVMQSIEYSLLEPATVPYSGSSQFNQTAIVNAMQKRRDQFLLETMCVITHVSMNVPGSPIARMVLSDNTIGVRRAAWLNASSGQWSNLTRSDEWFMLSYYAQPWTQQSVNVPQVHSVAVTPPLTIQLAPPPNDNGTLDLLVVQSGAALNPVSPSSGVLLGIPDDFTWAIKFGAMADLLGADGPAKDPQRAAYCERRYQEGVMLAKIAPSVMMLYIDGVPQYCESLDSVDVGRALWQNYSGNPPFMGGLAGLNLLAMVDPPGAQWGIMLDIVTNAIVPVNDGDFLQIGREELAAVLGYAQHLATFKCGGNEFSVTMKWLDRIMQLAATYNSKLKAASQPALTNRSQQEKSRRPAMVQGIA